MARVRVVRTVQIGGRRLPVKRGRLAPLVASSMVEVTAVQMRVLAEESRELLIDKLMAAEPAPNTDANVPRPRRARRPEIPTIDRLPENHAPLSDRTIARKRRHNLDGRPLIETGDYIRGIEVRKGAQRESGVNYIVRPEPRQHRGWDQRSGRITLKELARVHEFGSRAHNIPARPHWGPTLRAMQRRFAQLPEDVRAEAMRRALRQVT